MVAETAELQQSKLMRKGCYKASLVGGHSKNKAEVYIQSQTVQPSWPQEGGVYAAQWT